MKRSNIKANRLTKILPLDKGNLVTRQPGMEQSQGILYDGSMEAPSCLL